ncbi:tetratricopeptide repeat protein [Streptomyces sp. NPDC004111]|uniref:tetratricopeptide repeat protein n=1 Tax=Streptomyces sp. NPDC004111 TaxID=3364690 RepID=UPI003686AD19
MPGEATGAGDVRAEVTGGRQEAVVTARDITGPVTVTTAGTRVPGYLQDPIRWPLVGEWGALAAGAHRAKADSTGDAVPPYVARDMDTELRTRLEQAAAHGGLVLVVGDSTAGKTRAAHHAVHTCKALAGYRVLAPDNGPDLVTATEVLTATTVRCLVWLDDLEHFLGPDGLEPAVLAELTRLRTPVLATMQLRHYDTYYPRPADKGPASASGPRADGAGARVLKQTEPLHLPRRWSTTELDRARDCDDPRVIDAVTHHGPYGVAEYLAAGPALLTEWHHATRPGGHPHGAALVAAAVDLTRTGLPQPYPTTLLTTLTEHYLPHNDRPLLRPEPLEEALTWAQRLRYGATSLLLPTHTPNTWNVFDYLPDHTTTPIPNPVWETALNHATNENDRHNIALHASTAAPHIAEATWRPLAQHNAGAAHNLGFLLAELGRLEEAERWYHRAAEAGQADAANNLGVLFAQAGRVAEAEQWLRRAVDAGGAVASHNLGLLFAQAGRVEEAEQWLRRAAEAGNADAANDLGLLFAQAGRVEEAEQWLRRAAEAGNADALYILGLLFAKAGRLEEAEPWYHRAAEAGNTGAAYNLGVLLAELGRLEEAEPWCRRAAEAGHTNAANKLGFLLSKAGRLEEAEPWCRRAAEAGDTGAAYNLGVLLYESGRLEEAKQWYHRAAEAGNTGAAHNLGCLLAELGRVEEAEPWYRRAAEAGHTGAAHNLGVLLAQAGRPKKTKPWYRRAMDLL